ncbi:hypothetical protein [Nostoc sp. UHCC 0870]|uniref:hypothetical protein n=1 Tax=Nostoc sp. UHCC 0870 TaxID=2914041 RepID=UPI001EDCD2BD|nr:hypothetical protein [Nostoc sp. UHCC 0870]UKO98955.1 hypothetical protein L6494_04275 [Nostoc sp. UHCC 0870]
MEKIRKEDIDILNDTRVNCYSVMTHLTVSQYLHLVDSAFHKRGGLEGQRETLKSTTARRIRKRMVQDIELGAVLPPIVLGVIVDPDTFQKIDTNNINKKDLMDLIQNNQQDNISIIDGMQRTSALREALENNQNIEQHEIRIEYWIASQINSLTYRMLVLNTGQVPWNIRRQIEIVFKTIIKEIRQKYPDIEIMDINDERRRSNPGQFQADNIIELYLVFGARKEKIDVQERLADEFTRQDFIESTSNPNFTEIFYEVINYLTRFDKLFSMYKDSTIEGYFKEGKDLFSSQPACVGFVTAIALAVLGRPGLDYTPETQNQKWNDIKNNANTLLKKLEKLNNQNLGDFLDFNTLNELIRKKPGKSSYFEREFFLQSFKVLVEENFSIESMTPCWRSY